MPRRCSCCTSPKRAAIDEAIVGRVSFRGIARQHRVSADAVERHAKTHLPAAIVKARAVEEVANGDALLRQIQDLQRRTLAILDGAEKDDARTALVAIHQARENLALLSKLLAELRPLSSITPEMAMRMSDEELTAALVKAGFPRSAFDVPEPPAPLPLPPAPRVEPAPVAAAPAPPPLSAPAPAPEPPPPPEPELPVAPPTRPLTPIEEERQAIARAMADVVKLHDAELISNHQLQPRRTTRRLYD